MKAEIRRWLAFGTGVGVSVGPAGLEVVAARVRPGGVRVLGCTTIAGFRERPSAEWGAEYAGFVRGLGLAHKAAWVLLPRHEVLVRQLMLPGVADSDLASAVGFQLESLHPYGDDEAVPAWARLGSSPAVAVAIARRALIERYTALFAEAGVKTAGYTVSAAVLHSAVRLFQDPPAGGFVAAHEDGDSIEIYGESPARPLFSALFERGEERAAALAASELRLEDPAAPLALADVLPAPRRAPEAFDLSRLALPYATALAGACPWLALAANLLPVEYRQTSSRAVYAPTLALAGLLTALAFAAAIQGAYQERRHVARVEAEIRRLEPVAKRAASIDREVAALRARTQLLDGIRRRSTADLDALNELTRLLAPPVWLNGLELQRASANLSGYAEQAAGLLKLLDSSPLFQNSEFTMPMTRSGKLEEFRIRTQREGAPR